MLIYFKNSSDKIYSSIHQFEKINIIGLNTLIQRFENINSMNKTTRDFIQASYQQALKTSLSHSADICEP